MRVVTKRKLVGFWQQNQTAEKPLRAWYRNVNIKHLSWQDFSDIKATYATASKAGECVVFNVGGNKFRVIAKINYRTHLLFVRAVLTHADYDLGHWKADCRCD